MLRVCAPGDRAGARSAQAGCLRGTGPGAAVQVLAAQEGLTDVRRPTGASRVRPSAVFGEDEDRLVVADDGRHADELR
ncbi:hypothetical protein [Streptomyces sp. NRRL S-448]|uniref:hypothetical protein n=1 Tax=Streptomyces sp. NRRL S-448 TaxID=1463907 RepID=UPI0035673FFC